MNSNNALRIMIVEDDELTAWAIEEALIASGYNVCSKASDYESALRVMKQQSPDLALVDVRLNGQIDGIMVAEQLMDIKWIPLIYLTANTEMETYRRARKTSPAAFLHKPFRPLELSMQIDLALTNFYRGNIPPGKRPSEDVFVWDGKGYVRVCSRQIVLVNASGGYSELVLTDEEFTRIMPGSVHQAMLLSVPFGNVLLHLGDNFYRAGRSVCINLDYVDRVESDRVFLRQHEVLLPVGKHKELLDQLPVIRSRK
jgi:DNA-binding response OmpR family regulator